MNRSDSDDFLTGFLIGVALGYDINDCIDKGIEIAGNEIELADGTVGTYPIYYFGDSVQHLQ